MGAVNGSQLRPSFVVQRMEKLFPRLRVTREDGSYRRRLPATALELAGEDPALRQYFRGRGDYDRVLDAMDRGRALGRGRLSGPAVEALYGRSLHMSASRMDQVKRCHFGYFMQYGLRARDRRPAGFEAPEIGTFIHYLLENVAREVKTRGGWAAVQQPELRQLVREYTDRYAREEIDGRKAPGSGICFPGCGRRPMPLWRTWPGSWPSRTFPRWPLSWALAERTGSCLP